MAPPLLSVERVSRVYATGRSRALCDVSLSIGRNEHVTVTGPSGSGKSTLLHILSGLDVPTAGRVLFEGREPRGRREWARLRARRIGFVFQSFNLLPALTALENVEMPMFGVVPRARDRALRARELLRRVGLSGRAAHRPVELSGGEKQRLAIARSLANSPDLILADEPTGNLDSVSASEVLGLLEEVRSQEGGTLVVVTHDPAVAARGHRTLTLLDGRVVPGR